MHSAPVLPIHRKVVLKKDRDFTASYKLSDGSLLIGRKNNLNLKYIKYIKIATLLVEIAL